MQESRGRLVCCALLGALALSFFVGCASQRTVDRQERNALSSTRDEEIRAMESDIESRKAR